MAGAVVPSCHLYNGSGRLRLWRGFAAAAALSLALAAGGCSLSGQFDSYFGGSDKAETTGSITPPPGAKPADDMPPDGDLAYARAAASEVLKRNEKNASVPWENPKSGARGTVTPIASAFSGRTARPAAISWRATSTAASRPGCRAKPAKHAKGAWEVRSLKPWKRS